MYDVRRIQVNKIRFLSLILSIILGVSVLCFADGAYYAPDEKLSVEAAMNSFPQISAESYAVMDARTGEVLFSQKADIPMPIASTTKMMTALVVVEKVDDLDRVVSVDAASCGVEGSSVNLYKGEKISVRDLLYALMLESANDAAHCLALTVSGSVEEFAKLMNERAVEIGMKNTHFSNPHGLEDAEHYSTSCDMALLWREAMKNQTIRDIVATKTYKIPFGSDGEYRFLSNHNKLLKSYDACIGGKTGFTKAAGRCLVSVCEKNGIEIITVTLNAPSDWDDHRNIAEYAFSLYSKAKLADAGKITLSVPVVGGKKSSVTLTNKDSLDVYVRDVARLETRIEAPRFLYAPVDNEEVSFARVVFYYNGQEIGYLDLYSLDEVGINTVKPGFFKRLWNFITGK